MTRLFFIAFLFCTQQLIAQKTEEGFDVNFRPTTNTPRYYVVTEEKDGRWHRQAYYLPEGTLALTAWYKDKDCKIADGEETRYFSNRSMQSKGNYVNGKKEGIWIRLHENGYLSDSSFYTGGHLSGASFGWNNEGYLVDSSFFDGKGNGTKVSWYANAGVLSAGFIAADTNKIKRWNYYHPNGQLMAREQYDSAGKKLSCECFTDAGVQLDSCIEKEAVMKGGEQAWRAYVSKSLNPNVPVNKRAPQGAYMVMIRFTINTDGKVIDIVPLTNFGYGMEEEVMRMLKASPVWEPAVQFGRKVKAYRRQPVTFMVSQ